MLKSPLDMGIPRVILPLTSPEHTVQHTVAVTSFSRLSLIAFVLLCIFIECSDVVFILSRDRKSVV